MGSSLCIENVPYSSATQDDQLAACLQCPRTTCPITRKQERRDSPGSKCQTCPRSTVLVVSARLGAYSIQGASWCPKCCEGTAVMRVRRLASLTEREETARGLAIPCLFSQANKTRHSSPATYSSGTVMSTGPGLSTPRIWCMRRN